MVEKENGELGVIKIGLKKDEEEGQRVHDTGGGVGQGKQRRRRKVRELGGRGRNKGFTDERETG